VNGLDWGIMVLYFVLSLGIGLYFSKRAGKSTQDYFLSGRNLPWWLAGLSMVATTFAADTPLAVTELVATKGIAGNWLWWNMLIGGMLTVFFFARLWRRAGIMTDLELIELRYSGKPAAVLRGFRALYLGLFMNAIIMGWVNVAMASVLEGMFNIPRAQVFWFIALAMIFTALYSSLSGLWGVAVTDAFQFIFAMTSCVVLAIVVLQSPEIGGLSGLQKTLPKETFRLFPQVGGASAGVTGIFALSAGAFLAYIAVQWWASWYPGAEPGGGGYVAQRMMSTKNEKHSVFAVLFFQIAHYCLRPWPWIIVGLASMVLYPDLGIAEKKMGYIYAMRDFLPAGLKGLLVAAFFAAYMSTIATHLNWGTSYIVHDFWRRFMQKEKDERTYVLASRITTIVLMIVALALTSVISSISGAWQFIIECGAGLGLVLILRWYWWRVNAWSEITATILPIILYAGIMVWNATSAPYAQIDFPISLFIIVGATTLSWIVVTLLTNPTDVSTLESFYRRTRPGGILWKPISDRLPDVVSSSSFLGQAIAWIAGTVFVYSFLFGLGELFFGSFTDLVMWVLLASTSGAVLLVAVRKLEAKNNEHSVFE